MKDEDLIMIAVIGIGAFLLYKKFGASIGNAIDTSLRAISPTKDINPTYTAGNISARNNETIFYGTTPIQKVEQSDYNSDSVLLRQQNSDGSLTTFKESVDNLNAFQEWYISKGYYDIDNDILNPDWSKILTLGMF